MKAPRKPFQRTATAPRVDPDWDAWFDAWRPLTIPERQLRPDA